MSYAAQKITKVAALNELHDMLTWRRPAASRTEERFISHFIDTLPGVHVDEYGNRLVQIGDDPLAMFSCHTDTVHHKDGMQLVERADDYFAVHRKEKNSSCLGADCTTGVWIMRNMIQRKIPGLYIFHREEEVGAFGSDHIVRKEPHLVAGVQMAIAFDRKGYSSVITHQGSRTCSDAFANSLAGFLGGQFKPDPTGLFTDTKNYISLIGECTNLSVGYFDQHSSSEMQDGNFAWELFEAMCDFDPTAMTLERKPGDDEWRSLAYSRYDYGWSGLLDEYANDEWDDYAQPVARNRSSCMTFTEWSEMRDWIEMHADTVADFLEQGGITLDDLKRF